MAARLKSAKSQPRHRLCETGIQKWHPRYRHLRPLNPHLVRDLGRTQTIRQYGFSRLLSLHCKVLGECIENQLLPLSTYGVKSMSMGYLVGEEAPVVWRGLMLQKALQQLLLEVDWENLDVLVLDLPPGTGDTQLTITQLIKLDG